VRCSSGRGELWLRRNRVPGPLAAYADGFRSELASLGYRPESIERQVWFMAQMSRWLLAEGLDAADITPARVEEFLAVRRANGCRPPFGKLVFRPLLDYLQDQNVVPPQAPAAPCTPVDELMQRYHCYLSKTRDLASVTIPHYERTARKFLVDRAGRAGNHLDLLGMTGAEIVSFLQREAPRLAVGSVCNRVKHLRSLLRFLEAEGLVAAGLAAAIPPAAGWRETRLPPTLTPAQVAAMLDSCDRSRAPGIRDFAILMLLARLGLRAVEVARLQLGDIDWHSGEITIHGKGYRYDRLPLPVDVGEAIVAYLRDGRPRTDCRSVFMSCRAPIQAIRKGDVSKVVLRASRRAGLPVVRAHRLRHALASEMLRQGVRLPEISQVLRHRDLATTAIYAKVDRAALRSVAQPWPVVEQ
jgi:integrase/recombinase XerD